MCHGGGFWRLLPPDKADLAYVGVAITHRDIFFIRGVVDGLIVPVDAWIGLRSDSGSVSGDWL